ncbi:MAG: 23S rRNA (adenine(2030)-N(6))-methyltransferase RlmJ, partial [Alphaproteobacteria bacterium]|nr:23S rRNA (adenine(2030)-N(6))-methyltransferase RlmJ [Alphaproteobacteria bacterium]
GLKDAHERWAGGTYMLWYPIKDPAHAAAFHADIAALNIRDIIAVDFYRRPAEDLTKLNGAGLVVVNPPWTLRASLETALPVLVRYLTAGAGSFAIQTIAAE